MHTRNLNIIYPEVDTFEVRKPPIYMFAVPFLLHARVLFTIHEVQLLLRYRTGSAGPCKILQHPVWHSFVYPATLFAVAPVPVLEEIFREAASVLPDAVS
jgi:hypothetical protein